MLAVRKVAISVEMGTGLRKDALEMLAWRHGYWLQRQTQIPEYMYLKIKTSTRIRILQLLFLTFLFLLCHLFFFLTKIAEYRMVIGSIWKISFVLPLGSPFGFLKIFIPELNLYSWAYSSVIQLLFTYGSYILLAQMINNSQITFSEKKTFETTK